MPEKINLNGAVPLDRPTAPRVVAAFVQVVYDNGQSQVMAFVESQDNKHGLQVNIQNFQAPSMPAPQEQS